MGLDAVEKLVRELGDKHGYDVVVDRSGGEDLYAVFSRGDRVYLVINCVAGSGILYRYFVECGKTVVADDGIVPMTSIGELREFLDKLLSIKNAVDYVLYKLDGASTTYMNDTLVEKHFYHTVNAKVYGDKLRLEICLERAPESLILALAEHRVVDSVDEFNEIFRCWNTMHTSCVEKELRLGKTRIMDGVVILEYTGVLGGAEIRIPLEISVADTVKYEDSMVLETALKKALGVFMEKRGGIKLFFREILMKCRQR